MNKVSHKKKWNDWVVQQHVEPPPTTLIKNKHDDKSDKNFVKIKLRRYLTSEKSEIYEFKIYLQTMESRNSFLFVRNFKMNLKDSGNLDLAAKDQYICMLIRGEALRHFDLLSSDMDSTNPLTAEATILGLVTYFFPVNFLPNQQCSM